MPTHLHLGTEDPRLNVCKLAQFGLFERRIHRKEQAITAGVPFRDDDETNFTFYIPMTDDESGYIIYRIREYSIGSVPGRFHGIPPKGAMIFDLKVSDGPPEEVPEESDVRETALA